MKRKVAQTAKEQRNDHDRELLAQEKQQIDAVCGIIYTYPLQLRSLAVKTNKKKQERRGRPHRSWGKEGLEELPWTRWADDRVALARHPNAQSGQDQRSSPEARAGFSDANQSQSQ